MPTFEDWLNDPISIINNIFNSDKHNFDSKVQEYFQNKLNIEKNYYSIPSLNEVPLHEIKPNSLVRYRCMIQDIFDPVYYKNMHRLKHKVNGDITYTTHKYKDSLDIPEGYEIDGDVLKEHLDGLKIDTASERSENDDGELKSNLEQLVTLYCVPIPGENKWIKNSYKMMSNKTKSSQSASLSADLNKSSKRVMETMECETEKENIEMENGESVSSYGPVICQEKDTDMVTTVCKVCCKFRVHSATKPDEEVVKTTVTKKTRVVKEEATNENATGKKWTHAELNFPLGNQETGHACLVKLYDRFDDFKLNEMIEFVGVLSQDPSLAYDEHQDDNALLEKISTDYWQQQEREEKREEEKKTETFRLMNGNAAGINDGDEVVTTEATATAVDQYCNCAAATTELVDVSVTKQVSHSHTHKRVVLSAYPPSLVPRLHCLLSFKLMHNNPLLGRPWHNTTDDEAEEKKTTEYWSKQLDEFMLSLKSSSYIGAMGSENDPLNILRKETIDTFKELLLGDALAAEYLLMHLLSSVFIRKDVTVLGKFALNITNIPALKLDEKKENEKSKQDTQELKNFSECFFDSIKDLVPTSHLFPLTTDTLNKSNLIPNKDYNKDKLISGMLQLPDDFHLCIDETVLNTGQLNQKGLMNLTSIRDIIKWQKLNYDFSYHQQEFNTNIRVLVLSNTKSILPFDYQLKLDADASRFDLDEYKKTICALKRRNVSFVNNVRRYLTIVSKLVYNMNEHMQELIENDIVAMRKEQSAKPDNEKMSVDDFHLLLLIARLQTLSYGKTELGLNEWNRAKSLYFERIKRQV